MKNLDRKNKNMPFTENEILGSYKNPYDPITSIHMRGDVFRGMASVKTNQKTWVKIASIMFALFTFLPAGVSFFYAGYDFGKNLEKQSNWEYVGVGVTLLFGIFFLAIGFKIIYSNLISLKKKGSDSTT